MSWDEFLDAVAEVCDEEKENLFLDEMEWGFSGKKERLPLASKVGYHTMVEQLVNHKEPSSQIIFVYLPTPKIMNRSAGPSGSRRSAMRDQMENSGDEGQGRGESYMQRKVWPNTFISYV